MQYLYVVISHLLRSVYTCKHLTSTFRDMQVLATASSDGQVLCHSAADGAALAALPGHAGGAHAVLWDAQRLVSAGADGFVRLRA